MVAERLVVGSEQPARPPARRGSEAVQGEVPTPPKAQANDLSQTEQPGDLHRTEVSASGLWGGGSFRLLTSGKASGLAIAWVLLVAAAAGVGWGIKELAVSTGIDGALAFGLALVAAVLVLVGGVVFVVKVLPKI